MLWIRNNLFRIVYFKSFQNRHLKSGKEKMTTDDQICFIRNYSRWSANSSAWHSSRNVLILPVATHMRYRVNKHFYTSEQLQYR